MLSRLPLSTLGRGALGTFAVNMAGTAIAFALQILLARLMGLTSYGTYSFVISWLSVLVIFCTLGFESSLLRLVAAYRSQEEWARLAGLLRSSTYFTICASLIVSLVAGFVVWAGFSAIPRELFITLLMGFLLLPVWAALNLKTAVLQSLKLYHWARIPQFIIRPILFAALVFICWSAIGVSHAAAVMLLHTVSVMAVLYICLLAASANIPAEVRSADPLDESKQWSKLSSALMLVSALQIVVNQIDTIAVGVLLGVKEVGVYAVASRVSTLILFGMQAINVVAAPLISEAYAAKDKAKLQKLARQIALYIFVFSLPLVLAIILGAGLILAAFGPEYSAALVPLLFLGLGQLLNISAGPVGFLLTMTGNERESIQVLSISLALNVLLIIPGIWYWGVNGAALATGLAIAVRNILLWLKVKRVLGIDSSIMACFRRDIRRDP